MKHEIPRRGDKCEREHEIHGLKPPDTPTPTHDGTNKHRPGQRTNYPSRMVYTLNTDEGSEVSLSRLHAISSNGPHNLPNLLRVIRGYPVHDSRKQLIAAAPEKGEVGSTSNPAGKRRVISTSNSTSRRRNGKSSTGPK